MLVACGFVFSVVLLKSGVSCELQPHPLMDCAVAVSCGRATSQLRCDKSKQPELVANSKYVVVDQEKIVIIQCIER